MGDSNAYILGTDQEELKRLELQHSIWSSESHVGWRAAGFNRGDSILDLGCGPGSCSVELAKIVGPDGRIISIDRSESFIRYLNALKTEQNLPIDAIHADFDGMDLQAESLDGMYVRWALAWVPNPKDVIEKVLNALKPGSKLVIHEYYNWSTHSIFPEYPNIKQCIDSALKSFKDSDSEIDVGAHIPQYLDELGASIHSTRLMAKLAEPGTEVWKWPVTFYKSYFPRLVESGYLKQRMVDQAFSELKIIEALPYARLACPTMIEIIAEKR